MMSMPVNVVIKVKSLEEAKEALSNLKKIKEVNPHEIKMSGKRHEKDQITACPLRGVEPQQFPFYTIKGAQ